MLVAKKDDTNKGKCHLCDKQRDETSGPVLSGKRQVSRPQPKYTTRKAWQPGSDNKPREQDQEPWLWCGNLLDNGWVRSDAHLMPNH